MNLWILLLFISTGILTGYLNIISDKYIRKADFITELGLVVLLLSMGARIGIDERVLREIHRIGFQALLIALATVGASIIIIKLYSMLTLISLTGTGKIEEETDTGGQKNMTFVIIFSVISGILLGLFVIPVNSFQILTRVTDFALAVILFGIGLEIGYKNKIIFLQLKNISWHIIVIPFLVAGASIIAAVFCGFFLGLNYREAAAVASGFGWYSLSGVLLAEIYSIELGSLAFLTNIFRELIAILILPFVVKYLGKITSIAPGGATTMDVTLPIIKETAGEEVVIPAFINGVILSALVPVLVPFFINL